MKLIERENKIYVKGKCIGTVQEVLQGLLNSKQSVEEYAESTIEKLYAQENEQELINISANHSSSCSQDIPLDSADTLSAD